LKQIIEFLLSQKSKGKKYSISITNKVVIITLISITNRVKELKNTAFHLVPSIWWSKGLKYPLKSLFR